MTATQPSEDDLVRLRERIVCFAASRIGREKAEDLAQETMLVLHAKYPQVADPGELLPLAFRILRFKMAAEVRKSVRRGENKTVPVEEIPLASRSNPESETLRRERRELLSQALDSLGERCREILRLKMDGIGFEEIRRRLGAASVNTVYVWDLRCRRQLIERLRELWEPPQ